MSQSDPEPQRPGAERANDPVFARRGWVWGVVIGLTVVGIYLGGVVGLLIAAVVAAVFFFVASR
ncbi:hypothetical protein [Egicoccus sp. AB-alg2]|uniref:hypothetical protein n=1 Tax=Egicoccus sp. AB-alg2 TaxID=3242693 RepID=UPI00359D2EC8